MKLGPDREISMLPQWCFFWSQKNQGEVIQWQSAQESPFTPVDNKIFVVGNVSNASKKSLLSVDAAESSYGMVMSQLMGLNNFVPWKGNEIGKFTG